MVAEAARDTRRVHKIPVLKSQFQFSRRFSFEAHASLRCFQFVRPGQWHGYATGHTGIVQGIHGIIHGSGGGCTGVTAGTTATISGDTTITGGHDTVTQQPEIPL